MHSAEEEKSAWALIKQRIESDLATTAADRIELNVRGSLRWVLKADILADAIEENKNLATKIIYLSIVCRHQNARLLCL